MDYITVVKIMKKIRNKIKYTKNRTTTGTIEQMPHVTKQCSNCHIEKELPGK